MQRYVALLRGVNVGRANRVAMAQLRELVSSLGYEGPQTLLNSGNVVFDGSEAATSDVAARLEDALETRLGVSSRVVVLTGEQLAAAVVGNPLADEANDPSRLLVGFPAPGADPTALRALSERDWSPEVLALGEKVVYLWCPNGVAHSPLVNAVTRETGDSITARNWATVLKLRALLQDAS